MTLRRGRHLTGIRPKRRFFLLHTLRQALSADAGERLARNVPI